MSPLRILIVGNAGATNVAQSWLRAATSLGHVAELIEQRAAFSNVRMIRAIAWRLLRKRPLYLRSFSDAILRRCEEQRIQLLLTTGISPLHARTLATLRSRGVYLVNFQTDDFFNPSHYAAFFRRCLAQFSVVYTPRRQTMAELQRIGCNNLRYLPFGYDHTLFFAQPSNRDQAMKWDVAFVGGADGDRAMLLAPLCASSLRVALFGEYWNDFPQTQSHAAGYLSVAQLRELPNIAAISLVLVRRANRDDHVMRTFEAPMTKACLVVEDTPDHRAFFGEDGESVRYFREASDIPRVCLALLVDPAERERLAQNAYLRIAQGSHRYVDRIHSILLDYQNAEKNR
jgi:spore maturation protein CgeB